MHEGGQCNLIPNVGFLTRSISYKLCNYTYFHAIILMLEAQYFLILPPKTR